MTIYYYSSPSVQPAPATVATDNYFGAQDTYINQNGAARVGVLGSGLSAGKITLGNYDLTKPYLGVTGSKFPGLATPPIAPPVIATTLLPVVSFTQGISASFTTVSVFGGSGIDNEILNVSINPALPAGLSIRKSKVELNVSGAAPTVSGSGTIWNVTYTFTSTGNNPQVGQFYAVRGQTKTSYNGIWECVAVTGTTITLRYNANPSASGGATPSGQVSWNTSATTTITDSGVKSITATDSVNYWYNYLDLVILGTPTQPSATRSYSITFTDAIGQSGSASFTLGVEAGAIQLDSTLTIASTSLIQNSAVTAFKPVTATGGTGSLLYAISPTLPSGLIFNTTTGFISGTPTVSLLESNFTITVTDSSGATTNKTFSISISPPALVTSQSVSSRTITRSISFTPFVPVTASGGISPFTFGISPSLPSGLSFNTATGQISGTATESRESALYTVTATDSSVPSQTSSKTFTLIVNQLPALNSTLLVASSTLIKNTASTPFTPVSASGGYLTLSYAISPALPTGLTFSTTTGQISGTATVIKAETLYTVTVSDQANQTTSKQFNLTVGPPVLTTALAISARTIIQNAEFTSFTPVTASGGEGTLLYSISQELPSGLNFNTASGVISGSATVISSATNYTITATDQSLQTSSKVFSLTVESPPLLTTVTVGSSTLVQFQPILAFIPVSATGGFGTLTYSISPALPTGLSFNSGNGQLTGTPSTFQNSTTYTVSVTDRAQQSSSKTFNLIINTPPLQARQSVAGVTLIKTVPITSFIPVTATGGSGIYTYSISSELPAGLTLNASNGQISGTPTETVTETTYTITVTDSLDQTDVNTFKIIVNNPPALATTLVIETATFNRVVETVNITPVTASGGYGSINFAISPSLPVGLTFNSNNGRISGTAASLSSQQYTVTATDSIAQVSSKSFTLSFTNPSVVANTVISSASAIKTKAVTAFKPVNGTGGIVPLTYSITPALPSSMALNVNTGFISGTPSVLLTTTEFTVTVTDNVGTANTATFNLTVENPPPINTVVNSATINSVINQPIVPITPVTASGGDGALVYSISPSLPNGLQFNNNTGAITGTPTTLQVQQTYTVTATDSLLQTNSKTFLLEVVAQPLVATVSNATLVFTVYAQISPVTPVTVTGGTGVKTYAISPALPQGLSFNTASGQITGTPSQEEDTVSHTITVTDSVGVIATAEFTLIVNDGVPPSLTASAQSSNVSLEFNTEVEFQPVASSGGFGAVTYGISPELPAGLEFNTITGFITGVPTVLTNSVAYTVSVQDTVPQTASATFNLIVSSTPVTSGKGYTGSRGYTGSIGFTGSRGDTGFVGSLGYTGSIGFTGSAGAGFTGSRGDTGFVGSLGYTGSAGAGFTGSRGDVGYTGSAGADGIVGRDGYTGSRGDTGYTGSRGDIGYTGSQGVRGFTGSRGDLGFTGSQGYTGSQGDVGYTGSQGTPGTGLNITGAAATAEELPDPYLGNVGDGYITVDTGDLHIWLGSSWLNAGPIRGPQGYTGSGGGGAGGISFGNYDGGFPDSIYGGITPLDAGGVV